MKKDKISAPSFLRQKAEKLLGEKVFRKTGQLADIDFLKFIQELEVHEIELEDRLKLAIKATGFGTYSFDFDSGTATYSKEFLDIYGLKPNDTIELDSDLAPKALHPEDKNSFLTSINSANDPRGTGIFNIEFRIIHTDGKIRWLKTNGLTIFSGNRKSDRPLYANGIIHDITGFKESEAALRKSETEFRSIFDNSLMAISQASPDGKIIRINQAYADMYGYPDAETMLTELTDGVIKLYSNPNDRKKVLDILDEKGIMIPTEFELNRRNGEKFWALVGAKKVLDSSGNLLYVQAEHIDITTRIKAQNELENSREQLEQLNLYLQRVREEERKRISRELHDELGQALTAIKIDLGILKSYIPKQKGIEGKIDKISSLLNDSIITVQRLTSELRPHILDDLGLAAAIEWYTAEYIKRTGIAINQNIDKSISLPAEIELVIFRILQESLTNITRHSDAENVEIIFYRQNSDVILEIKDDGIGISAVDRKSPKSLGLFNMNERAKEIGGKFIIESRKKKGTRICLTVPDILFEE